MAFNAMRDVEPPYLRHNQMASYFEALCVIIELVRRLLHRVLQSNSPFDCGEDKEAPHPSLH